MSDNFETNNTNKSLDEASFNNEQIPAEQHEVSVSSEPIYEPAPAAPTPPRPQKRFMEISGYDRSGRPKAEIIMHHYLHYTDGTMKDIEEIHMRKPIVNIFCGGGFVNVFLDFGSRTDADFKLAFDCMKRYMDTSSGVTWTPDEAELGYYTNDYGEDELVYFPMMEIAISPIGREDEFMIHGYRPLLYAMFAQSTDKDLTGLQLVFKDNLFIVDEEVSRYDLTAVQLEAMNEARMENIGEFDPDDIQF